MHPFILHNDQIHPSTAHLLSPGQVGLLSGWGVFTTIRVCEGVLFEWDRHWARMARDARLMHVPMPPDAGLVHGNLLRLVERNQAPDATLRLVVARNAGGHAFSEPGTNRGSDVIALMAPLKQWGASVRLTLVPHARHGANKFAGTKILAWGMNLTWLEEAQQRGFDEVMLLNERGEVSECTSANLFAVKGNQVWTPPLDSSGCLPGVTRDLLLHVVGVPEYPVSEKVLLPEDFDSADEVFITSTTRDILTVDSIDGRRIANRGRAREVLGAAFSAYVRRYVEMHRAPVASR